MIDERKLIKTLEEWKSEASDVVGLKSEALLDKVIKEIGNQSIYHRITITDPYFSVYLDYMKAKICDDYCGRQKECEESDVKLPCPLDFL